MTQLDVLKQCLNNLGGSGHYSQIYDEYFKITGKVRTPGLKAGIRKCIEVHSSDSDNFKGNDVFFTVKGIGKGVWGLRATVKPAP